jgi:serine/threonine protein kinase
MPTETTTAIVNWSALPGTILEGGYEVADRLSGSESSAVYRLRILGDRFTEATVSVFAPSGVSAEQFALWGEASNLPSPSLARPLGVGEKVIDGLPLRYVMLRQQDETLADVLLERPLAADEVREVLRNAVDALGILHSRGYVHSCLSPRTVLAIGDSIVLATRSIRRINSSLPEAAEAEFLAPESSRENLTPEADIWCLGATVYQALTQKAYLSEQEADFASLPSPFHVITQRCLSEDSHARCTLSDIRAMLRGEQLDLFQPQKPRIADLPLAAESNGTHGHAVSDESVNGDTRHEALDPAPAKTEEGLGTEPGSPDEKDSSDADEKAATGTPQVPHPGSSTAGEKKTVAGPRASVAAMAPAPFPGARRTSSTRPLTRQTSAPPPEPAAESKQGSSLPPRQEGPVRTSYGLGSVPPLGSIPNAAMMPAPTPRSSVALRGIGIAVLGLILVAGLAWMIWSPDSSSEQARSAAAVAIPESATHTADVPQTLDKPNTTPPPAAAVPSLSKPSIPLASAPTASAVAAGKNWRVVAFTFAQPLDAEHKVDQISAKHPELNPEVFSPTGAGSPYLVVLGGLMSREEATRLRRRARLAGMPRDSYVQNYSH